jgi:ketosteroid isomerase-like protein
MSRKREPTDEAQIRKVIDDLVDPVRKKDPDGVLSHYAPSLIHFLSHRHVNRRDCVPRLVKFVSG